MRRLTRIIRNVLMLIAAVVVALAAIMTANTLGLRSRQVAVEPIAKFAVDETAAAGRLAGAIRFQTVSAYDNPDLNADAFLKLHDYIATNFPAFSKAAKREVVAKYSLLYTWEGSDPKAAPVAFLAHQDVVPIAPGTEGDWLVPPFAGVVRDGYIWGRGSWDDKGSLFGLLEAAESLAREGFKPHQTIYFAFGHDEEVTGQRGAKEIAALLASRGVKLDFVLDEGMLILSGGFKGIDKPVAIVGVAEKGFASVALHSTAIGGHSSMPPRDTAIGIMSAALARLEAHQMPARLGATTLETLDTLAPEMGMPDRAILANLWLTKPLVLYGMTSSPSTAASVRTTTALTIFNAGNKDNVLPAIADATVNFRLLPGDTLETVLAHVRTTIGDDRVGITPYPNNTDPPPVTGTASFSYRALNQTIREVYPDVLVTPGLMVAATDSRNYVNVTDKMFRFFPVRARPEDLSRFHGTNEKLSVENYVDIIRFYRRFMQNVAGG